MTVAATGPVTTAVPVVQPRAERLADPADLGKLLGVRADHPKVGPALDQASARFRGAVGHDVSRTTVQVVMDGNGVRNLLLPAVQIARTPGPVVVLNGATLTLGIDYELSSRFGILRRCGGVWPDQLDALDVQFTYGWSPIPDDIAEAVLDQAAAVFVGRPGIGQQTVGAESTTWTPGVTVAWSTAVTRYSIDRRS